MIPMRAELFSKVGNTELEKITNKLVAALKLAFEMQLASPYEFSWFGIQRRIKVENIEILNYIIINFRNAGYEVSVRDQTEHDKQHYPNYYTITIK